MMRLFESGTVTAHAPENHAVICQLKETGEMLNLLVRVPFAYADALRISQKPLPGLGSLGLIAFPGGDPLNAIWLGTLPANLTDAIHTNNDALDPHIDYDAHFSGHWSLLDGAGNAATQFADGSSAVMGASSAVPALYRHTVTSGQQRTRVPYTQAQRIPAPPGPFTFAYNGADGLTINKDNAGNVTMTCASLTLNVGGHALVLNSSGMSYGGPINAMGNVTAGVGTGDQVGLQTHKHPTAATGAPSAPTAGT